MTFSITSQSANIFMDVLKSFSRVFFDPCFIAQYRLEQALKAVLVPAAERVGSCLDVGCGDRPYEDLFAQGQYVGVDIEYSGRPLSM